MLHGEAPAWAPSDGYGYGDGYGDGFGDGYGCGDGSGSGDGFGDGYGCGDGYGDGAGDGSGYGDGSGCGAGSGAGSASGYVSGDGSGYGYVSGDGSGCGDGSGYGYVSGFGYGAGFGDGSGDSSGDSSGSGYYWSKTISFFAARWSDAQRARLEELNALGARICFWHSKKDGTAIHGQRLEPAKPGVVHTVKGPLNLCSSGALHATLIPPAWKGDRLWVVALIGETIGDEEKFGALQREIIGECLP
jgi:hypothetical protein